MRLRRKLLWSVSGPLKRQTHSAQQATSQPPTVSDALDIRGKPLRHLATVDEALKFAGLSFALIGGHPAPNSRWLICVNSPQPAVEFHRAIAADQ